MPRVVSSRGDVYEVADQEVAEHLANGYTLESVDTGLGRALDAGREERYSGLGAKVDAAKLGAVRGASLGLSDAFVSDAERDYVNAVREYNPITSGASEIAGALATAIPSGGNSLLARTPAGLATSLGTRAGAVVRGSSSGALRSILGTAAAGAVEGAAAGAGSYISETALANKELSAEGFLAGMGNGALWGGAIGGGLGAAERGFIQARKLWPKSEVTREAVQAAQAEASSTTAKAVAVGDEAEMAARRRIQELRAGNPAADQAAKDAAESFRIRQAEATTRKAEASAGLAEQKLKTAQELDAIKLERARNPGRRKPKGTPPGGVSTVADDLAPPPGVAGVADDLAPPPGAIADAPPMAATVEEAMEDAMAAVDPDIGALVKARRDYAFSKSQLPRLDGEAGASGRTWKVRGHQGGVDNPNSLLGGATTEVLTDAELAQSTMGRLKEALGKKGVTAEQRAAVEKLLTPKRLAALKRYEAGEVRAMPYWFNKEHVFEGKTFRISDLVDSEDIVEARRLVHGVRSDLETWTTKSGVKQADELHHFKQSGGHLSDFSDAKPFVDQFGDVWDAELMHNIGVIGDFERSTHAMTQALGDAAPMAARAHADDYARAMASGAERDGANIARMADHMESATALDQSRAALASPGVASGQTVAAKVAGDAAESLPSALDAVSLPGMGVVKSNMASASQPAISGAKGAMDALGVMELMSSFEGLGLPSMAAIPVIGPVLAPFLKLRAAAGIFKRLGGRIPATAEATVAAKAAASRNKVRAAVGRFLEVGERATGKAARLAPRPVVQALSHVQFDDGERRETTKDPRAQLKARTIEIARAVGDEAATRRRIGEQVRAADPVLAKALADRYMAKLQFLDSKLPRDPRNASPFKRPDYKPSQAELEKFARFAHYADNPADVFEDLAEGRVSLEGIETVKAVYPELYQDAQRSALDFLAARGGDVDYARRVQLSLVFDVVGDETLTPEYIAAMQAGNPPAAAAPSTPPTPPQPGLSGDPRRMVDSYQTAFDRRAS